MKIILFLMLAGCTRLKNEPVKHLDHVVFNSRKLDISELKRNPQYKVFYKTCYPSRADKNYDIWLSLKDEFKKKYQSSLEGLSEVRIETKRILDSSVFVPNETCHHVEGSPLTQIELKSLDKEISVEDHRHHVH